MLVLPSIAGNIRGSPAHVKTDHRDGGVGGVVLLVDMAIVLVISGHGIANLEKYVIMVLQAENEHLIGSIRILGQFVSQCFIGSWSIRIPMVS